jgi:hypothetical protein
MSENASEASPAREYEQLMERCRSHLNDQEPNSLGNQIHELLFRSACYRTYCAAIDAAELDHRGEPRRDLLVSLLLGPCFAESQSAAIRRLVEKRRDRRDAKKDVHSIPELIDVLRERSSLLTRGNWFAARRWPLVAARGEEAPTGRVGVTRVRRKGWDEDDVDRFHSDFNSIYRLPEAARDPADVIPPSWLDSVENDLASKCLAVSEYTDKRVAHAATAFSRSTAKVPLGSVMLSHVHEAERAVVEAFSRLNGLVQASGGNMLPSLTYDIFEYSHMPLVSEREIGQLQEAWQSFHREVDTWR